MYVFGRGYNARSRAPTRDLSSQMDGQEVACGMPVSGKPIAPGDPVATSARTRRGDRARCSPPFRASGTMGSATKSKVKPVRFTIVAVTTGSTIQA